MPPPWRPLPDGLALSIRLTPKSAHDRIDGAELFGETEVLKARVRAVPEDGKANAALEVLVAAWLDVPRRSVQVTSGPKSRLKTVTVAGDGAGLAAKAQRALAQLEEKRR